MPVRAEVRTKSRTQIARAADVENLVVPVAKEIHAGGGRRSEGEDALPVDLPHAWGRELGEIRDRLRSAFLRKPEQSDEDLGRRLRVGERPMTRSCVRAEEVRQGRKAEARRSPGQQSPRQSDGVDDGCGETCTGESLCLPVEEREVEARVVRDDHRVARKPQEAGHSELHTWRSAKLSVAKPGQRADHGPDGNARIDERLELVGQLELMHAHGADLADARCAGSQSGGLEVDDDVRGALERQIRARRLCEADSVAAPGKSRIFADHVVQQRAGQSNRCVPEGEEAPRRLLGRHRSAPLLHELDEPVRGVEAQLHAASIGEHVFVSKAAVHAASRGG